jgi:hypothetical protein
MTMERLRGILKGSSKQEEQPEEEETNALLPGGDAAETKKKKSFKKKKETKNTLQRALLNGAAEYGAQLVEDVIRASQVDGNILINQVSFEGNSTSNMTDSR